MMKEPARQVPFSVQVKTETDDGRGGTTINWETSFSIIGKMKALRGSEQIRGMALQDKVTHRIETWYDSRITSAHRLLYGTRVFNIRFVENMNERNIKMRLTVEEEP